MTAAVKMYQCKNCRYVVTRWLGQCPSCKTWDAIQTFDEARAVSPHVIQAITKKLNPDPDDVIAAQSALDVISSATKPLPVAITLTAPVRITDVEDEDLQRTPTNLEPLDRVLGGGLVADSVLLFGGDPGAGKSTLLAQAIAKIGQRVLYITGEETVEQATMRARRIGAIHPEIWIVSCNDVDEALTHARALKPAVIAIDSVQVFSCGDVGGVAGSLAQVRECTMRFATYAKQEHAIVILIGHVTKDGELAGPNTLKHLVDAVFLLEAAEFGNKRYLRASKNRFGDTTEVGIFKMCADGMIPLDLEAELVQEIAEQATTDEQQGTK